MFTVDIVSDLSNTQVSLRPGTTWVQFGKRINELTGVEAEDMKLVINGDTSATKYLHELTGPVLETVRAVTVIDTNENSIANQLKLDMLQNNDASFQFTTEDYESRKDSVLQWKKDNKLGKFNDEFRARMEQQAALNQAKAEQLKDHIGQRCRVLPAEDGSYPERRGWLRFVGKVPDINPTDVWCGIEFDEPDGKNNGTFHGIAYFGPVRPNYGGFVKPSLVETGPQFTPLADDELLLSDEEL